MSTSTRSSRTRQGVVVATAVMVAYAGGIATGVLGSHSDSTTTAAAVTRSDGGVLDEAADRIASQAAIPISRQNLERAAVDGMLKALGDRWSNYFPPAEYASFQAGIEGRYSGVGVWLHTDSRDHIIVGSVQADSPAAMAGLMVGDQITAVGATDLSDADLLAVATALRGPAGSQTTIAVIRAGSRLALKVTRGDLSSDDVTVSRLRGDIQLIRVAAFTRGVGKQVRQAMANLPATSGVVLDLRGDPGGLLTEAVEVAGAFLAGGVVVSYQKRDEPLHELDALGTGQTTIPLVVLVDGGTASAAEIVAAALQDRNRAVVVGSRTYGKGSVQEPMTLADGSALEFTVGRYLTPSGRSIDGIGVDPDISVQSSLGSTAAETRAVEVLRGLIAASNTTGRG